MALKVFDKTNPLEIEFLTKYQDIQSKDVIPLDNVLLMIGEDVFYQYKYIGEGIQLISSYQLN